MRAICVEKLEKVARSAVFFPVTSLFVFAYGLKLTKNFVIGCKSKIAAKFSMHLNHSNIKHEYLQFTTIGFSKAMKHYNDYYLR